MLNLEKGWRSHSDGPHGIGEANRRGEERVEMDVSHGARGNWQIDDCWIHLLRAAFIRACLLRTGRTHRCREKDETGDNKSLIFHISFLRSAHKPYGPLGFEDRSCSGDEQIPRMPPHPDCCKRNLVEECAGSRSSTPPLRAACRRGTH